MLLQNSHNTFIFWVIGHIGVGIKMKYQSNAYNAIALLLHCPCFLSESVMTHSYLLCKVEKREYC